MNNPDDSSLQQMIDLMQSFNEDLKERELSPEWRIDNLEYDLRTSGHILEKVRSCRIYSQHLYAALCNNEFTKNDVWPLLQEKTWSCSWRYAGGILADMRQSGDYMDWYCSGISSTADISDEQYQEMSRESQERYLEVKSSVPESVVTDEIEKDLLALGWLVISRHNNF